MAPRARKGPPKHPNALNYFRGRKVGEVVLLYWPQRWIFKMPFNLFWSSAGWHISALPTRNNKYADCTTATYGSPSLHAHTQPNMSAGILAECEVWSPGPGMNRPLLCFLCMTQKHNLTLGCTEDFGTPAPPKVSFTAFAPPPPPSSPPHGPCRWVGKGPGHGSPCEEEV